MKILISAAETSSDAHGAELLKALRLALSEEGKTLEAFGVGGPCLQAEGLDVVVDARTLLVMGFTEILKHIPHIFRALRQVTHAAALKQPDLAIVMDYPDFHFRLARRLRRLGIPTLYYIPPKVWAWRKGRIQILKKLFIRIFCIFPFEESFYQKYNIPVTYVGNPLLDELPLQLSSSEARIKLGINKTSKVLVLMPGSRPSELKQHLSLMLASAALSAQMLRNQKFLKQQELLILLLPFPVTVALGALDEEVNFFREKFTDLLDIRISHGNSAECLLASDAGLVKSGTSTLEAGLLKCPHVVVYKPSQTTAWIFQHLIRYRGPVGLVNLVGEMDRKKYQTEYLVREILCGRVTPNALAEEAVELMTNSEKRHSMLEGFDRLRERLSGSLEYLSPSAYAAREVIELVKSLRKKQK